MTGGEGSDTLMGGRGNDHLDGGTDADPDFLNGGEGYDTLTGGAGDILSGGTGADSFSLSDWLDENHPPAALTDFDAGQDTLCIVYDPAAHPDPELTLAASSDDPAISHLMLDGHIVAILPAGSGLDPTAILLMPAPQQQAA